MSFEDDDIKDREVWTVVSHGWHSKASDKTPTTGWLCHRQVTLTKPDVLQQLYYYIKLLCVAVPFCFGLRERHDTLRPHHLAMLARPNA
ncbi:hypothetical protein GQ53DRAFT_878310 [Thozetella sp. PMI_491]|nr:hypothetical protein GQ53DRAFT_878310 [Thozetella sp. PMI_491]